MLSEAVICAWPACRMASCFASDPISAAVSRMELAVLEAELSGFCVPEERVVADMMLSLRQTKEGEDCQNHDNEADQIDDGVHRTLPRMVWTPNHQNGTGFQTFSKVE